MSITQAASPIETERDDHAVPGGALGSELAITEVVIEPRNGWRLVDVHEIAHYRDLLRYLVMRGVKGRYAQSALGFGWAVIQPLATMLVFSVVFGFLVKIKTDVPYPVFALCGLVPWTFFATALNGVSNCLTINVSMLTKIYFPRLILPLSEVASRIIDLLINLVLLAGMMAWYGVAPRPEAIIMVPLMIVLAALAVLGLGLWLSALAVQYRDVALGLSFAIQTMMYLSPVIYPVSMIPARFQLIYGLNPMAGVITGFRSALLGSPMQWELVLMGLLTTSVLLTTGAYYFRQKERLFADVV